jgi:diacylglycerol kinase (ATP)
MDSCVGYSHCSRRRSIFSHLGCRLVLDILAISIVWTAEALNTAFEFLADAASPEFHRLVRDAKDVAAGAVLLTAIAASIIGVIIFWPYLHRMLS